MEGREEQKARASVSASSSMTISWVHVCFIDEFVLVVLCWVCEEKLQHMPKYRYDSNLQKS